VKSVKKTADNELTGMLCGGNALAGISVPE